jgi:DNA-binding NtrC family response regulator
VLGKRASTPGPVSSPPPGTFGGGRSLKEIGDGAMAEAERRAITEALQNAQGNKAQAARMLQVDYKTLYNKLKRYGLATP